MTTEVKKLIREMESIQHVINSHAFSVIETIHSIVNDKNDCILSDIAKLDANYLGMLSQLDLTENVTKVFSNSKFALVPKSLSKAGLIGSKAVFTAGSTKEITATVSMPNNDTVIVFEDGTGVAISMHQLLPLDDPNYALIRADSIYCIYKGEENSES